MEDIARVYGMRALGRSSCHAVATWVGTAWNLCVTVCCRAEKDPDRLVELLLPHMRSCFIRPRPLLLVSTVLSVTWAVPVAAFEGQGAPAPPATGTHPASTLAAPVGPVAGSWTVQGVVQAVGSPLVLTESDGGEPVERCLLCTVVGVTAAGQIALGDRFGLGVVAPTYPWAAGDETSGPALGDVTLWAPITLLRRGDGGVALRPFVSLPTGSAQRYLGDGSVGGGLLASGGLRTGPVRWVAELGADVADRDVVGAMELRTGVGGWVDVADGWAVGPELRGQLPLLAAEPVPSAQELMLTGAWAAPSGWSVRAGGGRGLTSAPGSAAWRALASLSYSPSAKVSTVPTATADTVDFVFRDPDGRPLREVQVLLRGEVVGTTDHEGRVSLPRAMRWRDEPLGKARGYVLTPLSAPPADATEVEVELAWEPVPVQVRVVDATGSLLEADIRIHGDAGEVSAPLRDDVGTFTYAVPAGIWTLTTQAPGFSPQERTIVVDGGRTDPMRVDAVLTRASDGVGSMMVTVTDPDGDPVEGALVRFGDAIFGTTGSGGDLTVAQLEEGARTLAVSHTGYEDELPVSVDVSGGSARPVVMLTHLPGSVEVRVRGPNGTPTPATVEVYSSDAALRPVDTGNDGRHVWVLGSGAWTLGITSPGLGSQERRIVVDHSERLLQVVDVQLAPALGPAMLSLRALDANGLPVSGAEVRLGTQYLGRTGSDGTLTVDGLATGDTVLRVTAPRVRPYELSLRLGEAEREVDALLEWLPGTVQVRALGPDGAPVTGEVRATDGEQTVRGSLDLDGRWIDQLPAGDWQVLVSAEELGLQTRDMVVEPDKTTLLTIDFRLAEVAGDASLALTLVGPNGEPVEGAAVFIDDRPFGTTGTGGTVRVDGLARGSRSIRATASGHEAVEAILQLGGRGMAETLTMPWGEGVVSIRVLQGAEPVTDAVLRLSGARAVSPVGTDIEGEARVALTPGAWTLLVSSVSAGLHQEQIEVPAGRDLTSLTVTLERVGSSTLLVRVSDEDGTPISGAMVELVPGPRATTSAGGAALLASLVPGRSVLRVDVPEPLIDRELSVVVGDGSDQLTVEALWPRSQVTVHTTDDTGQGIAADLLLQGAGLLPVRQTDANGLASVDLRPGSWRAWGRSEGLEGSETFEVVLGEAETVDIELASAKLKLNDGRFRFDEAVLFDVGSALLKPAAMPVVDALATRLKEDPTIVLAEVHGHTDDTGTLDVNMRLSQERAQIVLQALTARGVPPERLRARGFAMLRPVVAGADAAARSANRRVEVVVTDRAAR